MEDIISKFIFLMDIKLLLSTEVWVVIYILLESITNN